MSNNKDKYQKLADKIIRRNVDYEREEFDDRNVLERKIFPWILSEFEPKTVLDIGREDYQKFYNEYFIDRELWSIDFDPKRKKWGAKNHIACDAADVGEKFEPEYFDVVMMNGVLGWGLNEPEKIEKAFAGIYKILKPGGFFLLGYNDWLDKPFVIEEIENLKLLEPIKFAPLDTECFKCVNGEHTYRFYKKL